MARERVLEHLSRSANGFFLTARTASGVASLVHLFLSFSGILLYHTGTAVAQWLRYCATNRKVAGSIPDGAIGIFH
jgi:hypothetical protein